MQLLLHVETNSNIDAILAAAYAFDPPYVFKHIGNGVLETTVDASHAFTDAQWAIIAGSTYTITFVLPASVTPPPVVTPPAA